VTDGTGAVVVQHDYEPYGVEILPNNPTVDSGDTIPIYSEPPQVFRGLLPITQ